MAQLKSHPEVDSSAGSHPQPIEVGELVVISGAVELAGQFHVLETQRSSVAVESSGTAEAGSRQ